MIQEEHGGHDTDGEGSQGIVEEKTREAKAGEAGTTRVGMEGDDTPTSHGMVRPQTSKERDEARDEDLNG